MGNTANFISLESWEQSSFGLVTGLAVKRKEKIVLIYFEKNSFLRVAQLQGTTHSKCIRAVCSYRPHCSSTLVQHARTAGVHCTASAGAVRASWTNVLRMYVMYVRDAKSLLGCRSTVLIDQLYIKLGCVLSHMKSDNLQYNTMVCRVAGMNDSSTKCLMFPSIIFFL